MSLATYGATLLLHPAVLNHGPTRRLSNWNSDILILFGILIRLTWLIPLSPFRTMPSGSSHLTTFSILESKDWNRLQLPTLVTCRNAACPCLFYKFFLNIPAASQLILHAHPISCHSHPNAVYPERAQITKFQQSFFLKTAHDWNDMPTEIAIIISHRILKTAIVEAYSLGVCKYQIAALESNIESNKRTKKKPISNWISNVTNLFKDMHKCS